MENKLDCLTSLRFFAAAQVVCFHFGRAAFPNSPWWVRGLFQEGQQAVTFFFVLSGFILTYSYYEAESQSGLRTSRKDFWIARVARIYPVYLMALLIALVPTLHGVFVTHMISKEDFAGMILCCPFLLQAWIPQIAAGWDAPAWSLSAEAFFYILFPWAADKFLRKTTPRAALLATGILVVGVGLALLQAAHELAGAMTLVEYNFLYLFPLWHLPAFLFGMAIGRIFKLKGSKNRGTGRSFWPASACWSCWCCVKKSPRFSLPMFW